MLGGNHTAGMVIDFCPSPPPPFFDDIWEYLSSKGKAFVEGDDYERNHVHFYDETTGDHVNIKIWFDRHELAKKYHIDLSTTVDIILNHKFISATSTEVDGMNTCSKVLIKNLDTDVNEEITAKFFIDCSADAYLIRDICPNEGTDFFVGSDPKALYNESVYPDGYLGGNREAVNSIDFAYRLQTDPNLTEDVTQFDYVAETSRALGFWKTDPANEENAFSIQSTSFSAGISRLDYINNGHDYVYDSSLDNPKSVWRKTKEHFAALDPGDDQYDRWKYFQYNKSAEMLGVRERF